MATMGITQDLSVRESQQETVGSEASPPKSVQEDGTMTRSTSSLISTHRRRSLDRCNVETLLKINLVVDFMGHLTVITQAELLQTLTDDPKGEDLLNKYTPKQLTDRVRADIRKAKRKSSK